MEKEEIALIKRLKFDLEILEEFIKKSSNHRSFIINKKIKIYENEVPIDVNYYDLKIKTEKTIRQACELIEINVGLETDKDKRKRILKKMGYITKKELMSIAEMYGMELTDRFLNHYKGLGLIKQPPGTIDCYEHDTPNILSVIQSLKISGFKVKLEEFKYWFELLNLSDHSIDEIKKIYEEFKKHLKEIFQNYGITPKKRNDLLRAYDLRILNYEILITRFDILKRIFLERARTELDYKEIAEIFLKNIDTQDLNTDWADDLGKVMDSVNHPIDDVLDYPEIDFNLEIPEIKVIFKDPLNKEVIFKKGDIVVK